jgi:hypothetical protein
MSRLLKIADARLQIAEALHHRNSAVDAADDGDAAELRLCHARIRRCLRQADKNLSDAFGDDGEGVGDYGAVA